MPARGNTATVAVIEKKTLIRECVTRCLGLAFEVQVVSFPSVESWLKVTDKAHVSLLVLCTDSKPKDPETQHEISLLSQSAMDIPIVVLSDAEDRDHIINALDQGARGYIPTSIPMEIAVEAMRLVRAGGVFVPASSLIEVKQPASCAKTVNPNGGSSLTARQAAVVEAIRRGKANKSIARELNIRESTVKVHVRNIMRKLKAKNRTEVAFITNTPLASEE